MKNMVKGEKTKIEDLGLSGKLEVGVSCGMAGATPDISCFGVDADGKLSDDRYFIFYNQLSSPEKAIEMKSGVGGFDKTFSVDLQALPPKIVRLVFVATLDGNATFADLSAGRLELLGPGGSAASYQFSGKDFAAEKAVMIAEIYLKTVWRFAAVGQGFNGGLSALLKHFGGEEVAPAGSAAGPAAAPPSPSPSPAAEEPKVSLSKVRLDKQGEKHKVSLTKGGSSQVFHVNLQWDQPKQSSGFFGRLLGGSNSADLDLGCMWVDRNGEMGVIQPLGGNFGSRVSAPFITLDKDDRSGASADGENMHILRPETIELVVIFAMIYEGTANFSDVNARLAIFDGKGGEILIPLNSPDPRKVFCAVAKVTGDGNSLDVQKEERYFSGHKDCDQYYGFGFNWVRGSK